MQTLQSAVQLLFGSVCAETKAQAPNPLQVPCRQLKVSQSFVGSSPEKVEVQPPTPSQIVQTAVQLLFGSVIIGTNAQAPAPLQLPVRQLNVSQAAFGSVPEPGTSQAPAPLQFPVFVQPKAVQSAVGSVPTFVLTHVAPPPQIWQTEAQLLLGSVCAPTKAQAPNPSQLPVRQLNVSQALLGSSPGDTTKQAPAPSQSPVLVQPDGVQSPRGSKPATT